MEAHIIAQGKNEPPKLGDIRRPIYSPSSPETTFCVIEEGMASGEPSVVIVQQDNACSAVIQTSLDKFLMAAQGMAGMAESQWGWKLPEGYATLMPLPKKQRKALLESIKKELEEWEDE